MCKFRFYCFLVSPNLDIHFNKTVARRMMIMTITIQFKNGGLYGWSWYFPKCRLYMIGNLLQICWTNMLLISAAKLCSEDMMQQYTTTQLLLQTDAAQICCKICSNYMLHKSTAHICCTNMQQIHAATMCCNYLPLLQNYDAIVCYK